jgi:hypothetical protein
MSLLSTFKEGHRHKKARKTGIFADKINKKGEKPKGYP